MPVCNLIEHIDNYAKISGRLWQYHRDIPNDKIANSESFKFKARITWKTIADGNTRNIEILIPLKYLSNFWRNASLQVRQTKEKICSLSSISSSVNSR